MKNTIAVAFCAVLGWSSFAAAQSAPPAQGTPAPQKFTLAAYLVRGHEGVQRNLVEAAEKMPEEHYGFKPAPEMRPFAQSVAHIAFSRFGACSTLKGEARPRAGEKEDQQRSKAEAIALLKEAGEYCAGVFKTLTDEAMTQFVTIPSNKNEVAKGLILAGENAHANEVYGTMTVYLRLKGLVPPTTERSQQQRRSQ